MVAGGTGGHIFPALALADELIKRGAEIVWVGRPQGLESELALKRGFRFEPVPAAGFSGLGILGKARWLWAFLRAFIRSCSLVRGLDPDAVIAAGGYVSAAPLLCAEFSGKAFFLLEQNRIPGRVTKLFAWRARGCFFAFPPVMGTGDNCIVTGNPLRKEITAGHRHDDGRTVLVLGGSQGARALNLAAIDLAAALTNFRFIIITGRRDYNLVKSRIRSGNCELVDFTDRPEEFYTQATIAISRAGGMVLSELVTFGVPTILVPFPYATDKHQDANAEYLASVGAAIVLDQNRLPGLTSLVCSLMTDDARRREMSEAAYRAASPDAAQVIAERIAGCLAG